MADQHITISKGYKANGYIRVYDPANSRADYKGYVSEHNSIAEKVLGKPLPPKAEVHHFDETRDNNQNQNLVIGQDGNYHKLLHQRTRAFKACGHGSWRKCWICKGYDPPEKLLINGTRIEHESCRRDYTLKNRDRRLAYNREYCNQNRESLLAGRRTGRPLGRPKKPKEAA